MKRCLKESKGHVNSFCDSWSSENRHGRNCLSHVLSGGIVWKRRMALRTHNLISWSLKKRLWWIRGSDVSRCRKVIRTHFVYSEHRKKRLDWSRLCDVLCTEWPREIIICLLCVLKNDFRDVDVSSCWKAKRTHFLHSEHRKKATCFKF
jgi:hypothetical protein